VATAPPTSTDLDAYREGADRFTAELMEEYYLHYAGLKETLELESIYDRHSDLTTKERAQSLGEAVGGPDPGATELWRFACEGFLGKLTNTQAEKLAQLEAGLEVPIDGETIPFRMLRPTIANEADRGTRERLERARAELTEEHLNPVHLEAIEISGRAIRELGSETYLDLYKRFGWKLEELGAQCRELLDSTERLWEEAADRLFRARLGLSLGEVRSWDIPRLFRAPEWDKGFPSDRMLPALEATLSDLGVDHGNQPNVTLDIEQRPQKSPRAFCAPIEVPDKVMLVIQPIGGADDWQALFHEAGHTQHFAHTSPDLKVEEKRFGDNAVTEGWAMLVQGLTSEPAWLSRLLDFPRPREYAAEGAAGLLYFVRRYSAKLLYELEFHQASDPRGMRSRYAELLGDALKIEPSAEQYLTDVDPGFYVTSYLRSWAFEAQIRDLLRSEFGNEWFRSRDAGELLRDLWAQGQKPTADEMLREVTGSEIEMTAVGERIREGLAL
jgi:hypothetical protein